MSIITQRHRGPAQQPPQRVARLQLKHRPQYKPKASRQNRATIFQEHVYAERNTPLTTIVSNIKCASESSLCIQYRIYNSKSEFLLIPANGPPSLPPPTTQKKMEKEKDGVSEKSSSGDAFSRPRPVSFRAKPHAWALLRGRNKSYSLGHYSGEKAAQNLNMVLSSEVGVGCSLLDMDTEGQKRDCTVPLCRIQSSPARASVFELEKEFLS